MACHRCCELYKWPAERVGWRLLIRPYQSCSMQRSSSCLVLSFKSHWSLYTTGQSTGEILWADHICKCQGSFWLELQRDPWKLTPHSDCNPQKCCGTTTHRQAITEGQWRLVANPYWHDIPLTCIHTGRDHSHGMCWTCGGSSRCHSSHLDGPRAHEQSDNSCYQY